jgi:hypothetical protein
MMVEERRAEAIHPSYGLASHQCHRRRQVARELVRCDGGGGRRERLGKFRPALARLQDSLAARVA